MTNKFTDYFILLIDDACEKVTQIITKRPKSEGSSGASGKKIKTLSHVFEINASYWLLLKKGM